MLAVDGRLEFIEKEMYAKKNFTLGFGGLERGRFGEYLFLTGCTENGLRSRLRIRRRRAKPPRWRSVRDGDERMVLWISPEMDR